MRPIYIADLDDRWLR